MLRKVRSFPYEMPLSFSPPLALLITEVIAQLVITLLVNIELNTPCTGVYPLLSLVCSASSTLFSVQLLCKTPCRRLRTLERFKRQSFFNGASFDLVLLQRQPVEVTDQCLDGAISGVRGNVKCTMKVE